MRREHLSIGDIMAKKPMLCRFVYLLAIIIATGNRSRLFAGFEPISPELQTENALVCTLVRIQDYENKYHRLPKKLSDLPVRLSHSDSLVDGWGKPLVYEPQKDGSVILRSLGKDGANDLRSIRQPILAKKNDEEEFNIAMTLDSMENIERGIRDYVDKHHRLPDGYPDLPEEITDQAVDGWGGPILYLPSPDGTVRLSSRGKGGKQVLFLKFIIHGIKVKKPTPATTRTSK